MGVLWQDIRYGVRVLRKSPGFTAVAVLTLALGIGSNTAIFTLIDGLLLKSLPGVKDPHQLVLVTDKGHSSLPYILYERLREHSPSFSGLFAVEGLRKVPIVGQHAAGPQWVQAQAVSGNFFDVLGVPATIGRTLTANDDLQGQPQAVVVLSYSFWQRRYGLDPAAIGTTITLDDTPFTIVGVGGQGFAGLTVGERPDVWWPFWAIHPVDGPEALEELMDPTAQWMRIGGRLKAGRARAQVRSELDVIFTQLLEEKVDRFASSDDDRQSFLDHRIELEPGGAGYSNVGRRFERTLLLLTGAAGLVLLIACANLAGLLLARGTARQREFNLRAALGAGRLTLLRQLGTENLLLAGLGGLLGLLLAQWGVRLLASFIPGYGQTVHLTLTPDLRVLTFTFAISAFTGLLFGLVPAWRCTRFDVTAALREQSGAVYGLESGRRWGPALVVFQIALSCCLLIGAGLFVRTLHKLRTLDVGLNRKNLLVFDLDLGDGYNAARWVNLRRELLQRLEVLPGALSATFSNIQSLGGGEGGWGGPARVAPSGSALSAETGLNIRGTAVGPRYFETMGIPLRQGRTFNARDEELAARAGQTEAATRAVILDETSARQLFGDEDPVGRLLQPVGMQRTGKPWPPMEVIGIVRDVMHKPVRWGPRMSMYALDSRREPTRTFFYLRTLGNPLRAAAGIRQIVWELDPKVEVSKLQTVGAVMDERLRPERMISQLAGFFSLSALTLACLGVYGTLSYAVARRTREIGVRMALGARRYHVLGGIIRRGMVLVLVGCGLGVILAIALTRIVSSLLYGVTATDPLTFILTILLLGSVAFVSCWLPARRAAKIDPMEALRYE